MTEEEKKIEEDEEKKAEGDCIQWRIMDPEPKTNTKERAMINNLIGFISDLNGEVYVCEICHDVDTDDSEHEKCFNCRVVVCHDCYFYPNSTIFEPGNNDEVTICRDCYDKRADWYKPKEKKKDDEEEEPPAKRAKTEE